MTPNLSCGSFSNFASLMSSDKTLYVVYMQQWLNFLNLLFQSPIRGVNVPYNPNNFDECSAPDYGGYSEGRSRGRGGGGNRGDMGRGDMGRDGGFGR